MKQQNKECECGGNVVRDNTEFYCEECGEVLTSVVGNSPKNTRRELGNRTNHRGPESTYRFQDKGISTYVGDEEDYSDLTESQRQHMRNLRKWDRRLKASSKGKRDKKMLDEVLRMGSALDLTQDQQNRAGYIVRQARKHDLIKGYSLEAIASAALYIVCRCENVPYLFDDIETVSRESKENIVSAFQKLNRELNIPIPNNRPEYFVNRHINEITRELPEDLQAEYREVCYTTLKELPEIALSGRAPSSVAGGIFLYVLEEIGYDKEHSNGSGMKQSYISDVVGVNCVALRENRSVITDAL